MPRVPLAPLALALSSAPLVLACAGSPPAAPMPPAPAAAPAAEAPPAAPFALAGTQWELVSIQSMDDVQGTARIPDPSRYTLSFGADGRAAFRLDCNRGTGAWTATPSADGRSGSLSFGPIAGTRAMCPPPSIDTRVARDLGHVRSYRVENGQLHLSLMADAGIYHWRPAAR